MQQWLADDVPIDFVALLIALELVVEQTKPRSHSLTIDLAIDTMVDLPEEVLPLNLRVNIDLATSVSR